MWTSSSIKIAIEMSLGERLVWSSFLFRVLLSMQTHAPHHVGVSSSCGFQMWWLHSKVVVVSVDIYDVMGNLNFDLCLCNGMVLYQFTRLLSSVWALTNTFSNCTYVTTPHTGVGQWLLPSGLQVRVHWEHTAVNIRDILQSAPVYQY